MFRLILILLFGHNIYCAGVPAPDDTTSTILPPSLIYNERPPIAEKEDPIEEVVETQHSTCHISTDELVATARASVTRALKGLCNAREMDDRLRNLETLLTNQMVTLRTILDRLEQIENTGKSATSVTNVKLSAIDPLQPIESTPLLGELSITAHREAEINTFNSSIHYINTTPDILTNYSKETEHKVFTYYWKVKDMATKLSQWESRRSIRSSSFYISPRSYKMYLRMFPRQDYKNVYLHAGITKGEYDDQIEWPFKLKHRISVLDQRIYNVQDIHSRIWDPTKLCSVYNWKRPNGDNYECVGLGFSQDLLKMRDYLINNTLVVKLTVYLEL